MGPADTAPEIRRRQLDVYRALGPERRLDLALAMSEEISRVAQDGIRSRNPDGDKAKLRQEWLRMLHGARLATVLASAPSAS